MARGTLGKLELVARHAKRFSRAAYKTWSSGGTIRGQVKQMVKAGATLKRPVPKGAKVGMQIKRAMVARAKGTPYAVHFNVPFAKQFYGVTTRRDRQLLGQGVKRAVGVHGRHRGHAKEVRESMGRIRAKQGRLRDYARVGGHMVKKVRRAVKPFLKRS